MAINGVASWIREQQGEDMEWARTLAYITGTPWTRSCCYGMLKTGS